MSVAVISAETHSTCIDIIDVFYGAGRRKTSEREGCWVYLCAFHHNMSNAGVHFDKVADLKLKRECQEIWEDYNKSDHDGFRRVFGVSYV